MLCTHTDVSVWTRDIPRRGIALSLVGNNWEGKNMDKLDVHINGECFWGHDMCTQLSRKKKNKVGCYQKVDGCSQPQIFGDDHVENHQTLKRQT